MKELGMDKEDISKYLLKVLEEKLNENSWS
jgi:hypothetical protein